MDCVAVLNQPAEACKYEQIVNEVIAVIERYVAADRLWLPDLWRNQNMSHKGGRKYIPQVLERGTVVTTMKQRQGTQCKRSRVGGTNCVIIRCILVLCMSFGEVTRVDDRAPQKTLAEVVDANMRRSGDCDLVGGDIRYAVNNQPNPGCVVLTPKIIDVELDTCWGPQPSRRARQLELFHHDRTKSNQVFQVDDELERRQSGQTKDCVCRDFGSKGDGDRDRIPCCGFVPCFILYHSDEEAMTRRVIIRWVRHGALQLNGLERVVACVEEAQAVNRFGVLGRHVHVEQQLTGVKQTAGVK